MQRAIALAAIAGQAGDVPVGAVVVNAAGECLTAAANRKERDRDPTAHAEILALRAAARVLGDWHLESCTLYVTLEPCAMCAGALLQARLGRLVYGADEPKTGAIRTVVNLPDSPLSNHRLVVLGGVCAPECRAQLQTWFASQRR
ncbi:MAG: nucleoside deaminase [Spirulinaceae cyanobacterium SM2_1_0]|nr:nucleoside deaminase [Spirulinaceae cyanobacterium SM2_1_0]